MSKRKSPNQELLQAALAKFEIDPDELAQCPPLTSILGEAAGGIPAVIAAMRFSSDPNVEAFFDVYDKATSQDWELLPFEAFCLKANVNIPSFLGAAILALGMQSANIVKVIASSAHPEVMRASVRNALKPGGYKDRQQIHTAMRFLPQPKGATTIVQLPGGAAMHELSPDDIDTQDLFPDLAQTQKLLED